MRAWMSFLFLMMAASAAASDAVVNAVAPAVLPGVTPEMRSAGFWINQHPAPDALIMDVVHVRALNHRLAGNGLTEDFLDFPAVLAGSYVSALMEETADGLKKKKFFGPSGQEVEASIIDSFDRELDAVVAQVEVGTGFIVQNTDMRLLPERLPLYATPGDIDFDQLQNSGLAVGEPVLIYHRSRDKKWYFVRSVNTVGWVNVESVGLVSPEMFVNRAVPKRPLVIVSSRADIFSDKALSHYVTSVRMGTVFAYQSVSTNVWEVTLPVRLPDGRADFASFYIAKQDASSGYLPFTARTIYQQAFRLLDAPYGWGDMNGGQDCSRFLQMIYATVGIVLPRNSAEQGQVGRMVAGFDPDASRDRKREILLEQAEPANTMLRLNGHIMLYLGMVNGDPYAIHAAWAYRDKGSDGQDRARVIGRVAVSGLNLGFGSAKGSLLERIISARIFR